MSKKNFKFLLSILIVIILFLRSPPFASAFDFEQLFAFNTKQAEDKADTGKHNYVILVYYVLYYVTCDI